MKILADHTTLHSLIVGRYQRRSGITNDLRGLLQFAELVLFCDEVWLSNFEVAVSEAPTEEALSLLNSVGLHRSDHTGVVRRAEFSPHQYQAAVTAAADQVFEVVDSTGSAIISPDKAPNWRTRARPLMSVDVAVNLTSMFRRGRHSSSLQEGRLGRSVLELFEQHEGLREFLRPLAKKHPSWEERSIYRRLDALSRASIDSELARALGAGIQYCPSFAIADSVGGLLLSPAAARIRALEAGLYEAYVDGLIRDGKLLVSSASVPVPVMGLSVLLGTSRRPTMSEFLERLVAAREREEMLEIRQWLSGRTDAVDVRVQVAKARRALGLPVDASSKMLAKWTFVPPRFQLEIQQDLSDLGHMNVSAPVLSRVLNLLRRRPGTLLTGWLKHVIGQGPIRAAAQERARSLLNLR